MSYLYKYFLPDVLDPDDPLYIHRQYYDAAQYNLDSFIQIRLDINKYIPNMQENIPPPQQNLK
jgi:hypothetical protein